MRHLDVAELVLGLDEVVAGVEVAGVLEREREPAGLGVDAEARAARRPSWRARRRTSARRPRRRRGAPTPRRRRSGSGRTARRVTERSVTRLPSCDVERAVAPGAPGHAAVLVGLGDPLDDRDELDEAGAALVPQEAVDLAAVVCVRGVDRRQRVPLDARRRAGSRARASPGRRSPCRPCSPGRRRAAPAGRRSRSRPGSRARAKKAAHSSSSSVPLVWIV